MDLLNKKLQAKMDLMEAEMSDLDEIKEYLELSADTVEKAQNALEDISNYKQGVNQTVEDYKQEIIVMANRKIAEFERKSLEAINKIKLVKGEKGETGKDGNDGLDGETPEVDYEKIVNKVLKKIPKPKDGKDGKDGTSGKVVQLFGSGGGVKLLNAGVSVRQDQTSNTINLVNGGAVYNPDFQRFDVTITGSGTGGHTIQDEGTPLTARTNLNFVGATVTVTDDAVNDATKVTITAVGGGGDVTGPATNTDSYIPQWNGANSKLLKDGLAVPAGGLAGLTALGGKQDQLNGTGFVKATGTSISYDNSTYLTSVTAHNLLSTTHGDTTADTVVRGDIITGQGATPKWARLAFPATPTGKILQASATDVIWSTNPLTIGTSASVSGSNTGDQDLSGYELLANKSINVTTDGASDTKYPSVKAVKTYADNLVAGLLDYRGAFNASVNAYPTTGGSGTAGAIMKGDMWIISVGGTMGTAVVQVGDSVIANTDTPGQTDANWNVLNGNIAYVPENSTNKVTSISAGSTDTQYPSAKLLFDQLAGKAGTLSGTINEIAYFSSTSAIGSLAVATYPSLTELSYVKGVTSAIQTQLNAKGVGNMVLASAQSVTGAKTFDKDKILMKGTSTGATTISTANISATNYTATLQASDGTLAYLTDIPAVTDFATKALDNLASVAINSALIPGTAGALDLGSTTKPWASLWLAGTSGTPGTNQFKLTGASTSGVRTITLPDRSLTLDNITTSSTTNGTGFLKGNGSVISFDNSTYLTSVGTGTINELTYWSGANSLGTLAVATYPSLTEVSYVKGVTSALQTQLNALVPKSLYDAYTILMATTDNTPVALTVTEQTVVGRATGGAIAALAIDSDLSSVSANDDTIPSAKATKAMGDLKLPLAGGTMTGKIVKAGTDEVGKTYTPATGAQTVAIDCAVNNIHVVSGHASGTAITFTIANATNSQPFIISILQGGTTVSTITAWFATVRWAGGSAPTLTATLNKRDTFGFIRTGANTYDGFIIGQNC